MQNDPVQPIHYNRLFMQILISGAAVLFLILTGMMIYAHVIHAPFVLDDMSFIRTDPNKRMTELNIEALENAAFYGKPRHRILPNVSFAINYRIGQYNVTGYHIINISIHLLTSIILFFFFKTTWILSRQDPDTANTPILIPFLAAMIWLVHPVATQSVTYICQRMTSMAALFYILSLFLYVKGRIAQRSGKNVHTLFNPHPGPPPSMERGKTLIATLMFAGCLISGIAAVASKENAGMLPIFILLYEWFFFQDLKSPWSSKKLLLITFAAILFSMIAITYLGENPINRILQGYANRDFTMFQRVITEWRVVVYYISLFFFPSPARLSLEHDYPLSMSPADPLTTFFSLTAIIGLIGVALYKAQKDRLVLFCILWFMGNLIIESSVIGIEIIFEHRTYLPFMMVALLAAALVERVILPKKKAVVLLFGLSLLFAVWTHQRNALWADTIVFLDDCVQKAPDKIRPRFNLATELQLKGNSSDSIYHLEQVLKKDPLYIKAYNNIGNIWISLDNIDKALDYYFMALSLDPAKIKQKNQNLSSIHLNLGSILLHRKMADEAAYHFQAGLNLNPHNAQANYLMGVTLMQTGEYDQAENYFKKALLLDPELDQAQRSILQIALLKKTPIKHGKKIIEIYPENIPLHFRLGGFYQKQNDPEHAVAQYRKILELEPHHDGALKGMKDCNG